MLTRVRKLLQTLVARYVGIPCVPTSVELHTARLLLRDFRDDDLDLLHAYHTDPDVLRYLGRVEPWTGEEIRHFLYCSRLARLHSNREQYNLAVVRVEDDILVGDCSLTRLFSSANVRGPGAAMIGYAFDRRFWGHGYATEAAEALIRFAFEQLGVASVFGGCCPENIGSRRVLEKAGLRFAGEQDEFPGSPVGVRSLVFRAEREKWLAGRDRSVQHSR
jgi:RimJ/RimL family protein N-acetyltransferase